MYTDLITRATNAQFYYLYVDKSLLQTKHLIGILPLYIVFPTGKQFSWSNHAVPFRYNQISFKLDAS